MISLLRNLHRTSIQPRGFTLLELLATVAIITILAAILFPAASKIQQKGQESSCLSRIRQIGAAVNMSVADNGGTYPKFVRDPIFSPNIPQPDIFLEPYLGTKEPNIWHCPSDSGKGVWRDPGDRTAVTRSYSFNSILMADLSNPPVVNKNSIAKLSATVLVCENWVGWLPSTSNGIVTSYPYDQTGNGSPSYKLKLHRGEELSNYVFADGHAELLNWRTVSPSGLGGRGMFAVEQAERDGL